MQYNKVKENIIKEISNLTLYEMHSSTYPFICQICGKSFKRLRDLSYHINISTDHETVNPNLFNLYLKLQLLLKSDEINKCWIWNGYKCQGYGGYGDIPAHRLSYKLFNDTKISNGKLICHKCDNPLCINPNHLYEGTAQDNMNDMKKRGRSLKGDKNPSKREEVRKKLRKSWLCIDPYEKYYIVNNLKQFCNDNNINYRTMIEAGGGFGWKCKKLHLIAQKILEV